MEEKKLFTPRDVIILGIILGLSALLFYLFSLSPQGTQAYIERNGELLHTIKLSRLNGPYELEIEGERGITLTVTLYNDGAQVTSSNCPDKVCMQTGRITRANESALCLPAKVSVRLEGQGSADAYTY